VPDEDSKFPWPSYYRNFNFFEARMRTHSHITSIKPQGDGVYEVGVKGGGTLKVFVCDCYSFGTAEYVETTEELGELDAIIINSAWCGYTADAKRMCRGDKVGLFKIRDFMSALNKHPLWAYLNETEVENFKKKGWL